MSCSGAVNGVSSIPDTLLNHTTIKVLVQNVQVLGTTAPPISSGQGGTVDPNTGKPAATATVVILSVTPQQAEEIRFAELDGNLSLLLRSPQDAAAADVTTTGVTLRELVDDHGVLPPRVVVSQIP